MKVHIFYLAVPFFYTSEGLFSFLYYILKYISQIPLFIEYVKKNFLKQNKTNKNKNKQNQKWNKKPL